MVWPKLQRLQKSLEDTSRDLASANDRADRSSVDRKAAVKQLEQAVERADLLESSAASLRQELSAARRETSAVDQRLKEHAEASEVWVYVNSPTVHEVDRAVEGAVVGGGLERYPDVWISGTDKLSLPRLYARNLKSCQDEEEVSPRYVSCEKKSIFSLSSEQSLRHLSQRTRI